MRQTTLILAIATALLISACGGEVNVEVGGNSLSKEDIEAGATAALTKQVGEAPASLVCPSDLDAKVGESEVCTLTDDKGNEYDTTVTITKITDGVADYDIKVAARPN